LDFHKEELMLRKKGLLFGCLLSLIMAASGPAAEVDLRTLVRDFFAVPSVTGNEELLAARIKNVLPPSLFVETDNLSSVYARSGAGEEGLAILAPLDEFGWFVSGMTEDGYLRLDRAAIPPHSLYDSFLLGHAVVISTASGLQNGVIAQPSIHLLTRERRAALVQGFSLDFVYLDIGAHSEEEIKSRHLEYLDPVSFRPDLVVLAGDQLAGPALGQKAVCAALVAAAAKAGAARKPAPARFVWMAQTRFTSRGTVPRASLGASRARNRLQPRTVLLLDVLPAGPDENGPIVGRGPVLWKVKDSPSRLESALAAEAEKKGLALQHTTGGESFLLAPFSGEGIDAVILALPARFSRTPSEVISLGDVQALADLVEAVVMKGGRP
jgi:putative aminopeptidase FrvX